MIYAEEIMFVNTAMFDFKIGEDNIVFTTQRIVYIVSFIVQMIDISSKTHTFTHFVLLHESFDKRSKVTYFFLN